jgi:AraC-like DNA-binding protein
MLLQIRNMESDLCKAKVRSELTKLGLQYKRVELGEVEIKGVISGEKLGLIDTALKDYGFELMYDKNNRIVEKIKASVYQLVYKSDDIPKQNFSSSISRAVNRDYTYLSNLFSSRQGMTIESYIIHQKIARIKELLVHEKESLSNIAFKLKFSSVAHLSNQFKKVTGLTPSFFKKISDIELLKL